MEKIRLELEALEVETFDADAPEAERGTVHGHSDLCQTQWGQYTCVNYYSCDPWIECLATIVDNTCPGVNDC